MSRLRLSLVSDPASLPVTLGEAKDFLGVTTGDTSQDEAVEAALKGAVGELDGPNGIGVCFVNQTWRLVMDDWCPVVPLALGPVSAVAPITYVSPGGSTVTLSPSDYRLIPGDVDELRPAYGLEWPAIRRDFAVISITFVAGYGDAEAWLAGTGDMARIKQAVLLLTRARHAATQRPADLIRRTVDGVGSRTYDAGGAADRATRDEVEKILAGVRRGWVSA